jgi:hypothetical protein
LLDTAYAATHLDYHPTTEEQIAADQAVAQRFNLDAERLGWDVRLRLAHRGLELVGLATKLHNADAAARHAGRFEDLRPGAINEAARLAFESKPRSWAGETLLRLLWASMQDPAEFRARAGEEYRRVRKNVVGDDVQELTDRRDFLDREFTSDRRRWHDRHDGLAAVLDYATGATSWPVIWPKWRGLPKRIGNAERVLRMPGLGLRDYSVQFHDGPLKGEFHQIGGPVRSVTAEAVPFLVLNARLLKRIGRLYKFNCWFDYYGRVPQERWSRATAGIVFMNYPGARPSLAVLERSHEARLRQGLPSNIRHAPQGGTVKISRPVPAVRYAELRRDMTGYNDKHGSYMGTGRLSRRLREQKSLNIPKPTR